MCRYTSKISHVLFILFLGGFLFIGCGGDEDPASPPATGDTVGPEGGTVTAADDQATLTVPSGALADEVAITVAASTSPPAGVLTGTAYTLDPDGTTFAIPSTLGITYDPSSLPGGTFASDLVVCRLTGTFWLPVAVSQVDSVQHVVTTSLDHLSTYGIMSSAGNGEIEELTIYVVDTPDPGDETQFANLTEALAYLADHLVYEDFGTIVIQSNTAQQVATLTFPFDLVLIVDEGFTGVLEGPGETPLQVDAVGAFGLHGFQVDNPGGLAVNANRNLDFQSNTLPSSTAINFGGVEGAPCPAQDPSYMAKAGTEKRISGASFEGNHAGENVDFNWSGQVGFQQGEFNIRNNSATRATLGGVAPLSGTANLNLEANIMDIINLGVDFEAQASMRCADHSLSQLSCSGQYNGQNTATFEGNTTTTFNMGISGLGDLSLVLRNSTGGQTDVSLNLNSVAMQAEALTYTNMAVALLAAAAGNPEYLMEYVNTNIQRFDLTAMDNDTGRLTLGIRAGSQFNELILRSRYQSIFNLDHGTVRSYAQVEAHANVMDITQSHFTYEAGIEYLAQGIGAALFIQSDSDIYRGLASYIAPPNVQFGLRIDSSAFLEGGVFFIRGANKELATLASADLDVRSLPSRSALDVPQEIRLNEVTWQRSGYDNIEIYDVNLPVIIEGCVITQEGAASTAAVTLMELDNPVTITGNVFTGSGINLQEVTGAISITRNAFNISNSMASGITVGDCGAATINSNVINCAAGSGTGFTSLSTDGIVTLTGNVIDGSLAISALAIGGGIVHADGNTSISGLIHITDGQLRLAGNTLSNCQVLDLVPTGGLLIDPVTANEGLNPYQCMTYIDWDGNGCCDYPPPSNVPDEHGVCPCDGVSPPGK